MASAVFSNEALKSKFRGCLIGGVMGDCLGEPFELVGDMHVSEQLLNSFFSDLMGAQSNRVLPYTDDTCMTLSIASSLVEKGKLDSEDIARKFVADFFNEQQPSRGYGVHVRLVFYALRESNFKDVFLPAKLQFNGGGSYGNGAAMRTAPIALFGSNKGEDYIIKAAEECSRITHTHPNGYNGAILQSLAVNATLGLDSSQDLDPVNFISKLHEKMENIEKGVEKPYCKSLKKIKNIYLQKNEAMTPDEIAEYLGGHDETALGAVPTAIYSFLRGMKPLKHYESNNPFLRTLFFAISIGGDTDTIAAMAGNIAGAYYGADIIPEVLQKRCESIDKVIKLADDLFNVSQEK